MPKESGHQDEEVGLNPVDTEEARPASEQGW